MKTITTIGLDIAKSVFQVHGIDAAGPVYPIPVLRRRARRHSVRENTRRETSALADIFDGPAADQSRGDRARQQARQDGLGHDGQGRELQRTSRAREIACCGGE